MSLSVIILAAGKGTRMKSTLPKVLHAVANKPLVEHVYDAAKKLGAEEIVIVYGHGGEQVLQACKHFDARWVEQKQQLGTGHAVQQALPAINLKNTVLVLYGDVPLTKVSSLQNMLVNIDDKIALMTVVIPFSLFKETVRISPWLILLQPCFLRIFSHQSKPC